jgi:adenine-specific DNA-methyltransferase
MINQKLEQAKDILKQLGLPKVQQNDRTARVLLALLDLKPNRNWTQATNPMRKVTEIMDWIRDNYDHEYAPNTRETIRRQSLHQMNAAGITLYNPDNASRAVNSPHNCYQISDATLNLIQSYSSPNWAKNLQAYLENIVTLTEQYRREREMNLIPVTFNDNIQLNLSAGEHSELIKDIIVEFAPRFTPASQVVYVGDTGDKHGFLDTQKLRELGVVVNEYGKMPDVVLYYPEKNWLILAESVTSHGPIDGKRYLELKALFKDCSIGVVFVTAFPSREIMRKYLSDIAWETEVWVADNPTHLIHFNGVRFLGPY